MIKQAYVRAYQKGDALRVTVQEKQQNEAKDFGLCFDEIQAYSLCVEDKILGVFGYEIDEKKVAYCYALFSDDIKPYLLILVKFIKKEMDVVRAKNQVIKMMMTVKKDFVKACKFARALGFYYVRDLREFYKGEDYQLFERM